MTTAAVYCRKSTDQSGVADPEKSVAHQLALARTYAAAHGWTIDDAHIYADDGISGAEFAKRPGLVALLAALKPTPPFAVLLLFDADRLGREQFETSYLCKQLDLAGVAIHETKPGGRALTFDTPMDKLMTSLLTGAAEIEKAKVSVRTRSALQAKFERGHVVGGAVFGYTNVAVLTPDGKRSHVTREDSPRGGRRGPRDLRALRPRRGGPHHRQAAQRGGRGVPDPPPPGAAGLGAVERARRAPQ